MTFDTRPFVLFFFLFVQSADDKTRPCVCVTDISMYIQPASHFNQLYSFRDCLFSSVIALYIAASLSCRPDALQVCYNSSHPNQPLPQK